MVDVLTNLTVVIFLQYTCISNQHIVYLKLTLTYVNYISLNKTEGKEATEHSNYK